jgi:amidase
MSSKTWQEVHAAKKAEQASRIPSEWTLSAKPQGTFDPRVVIASSGILSAEELKITEEYDATALTEKIAEGALSALEVVTAFAKRAAVSQQLCNNLTEIMFGDAIEEAKRLDEHFKSTGKTVGPLHGLPMTFKAHKYFLAIFILRN